MSSPSPWRPLWIGPQQRQLYAALHAPAESSPRIGLLLAPPLLHELPRSRRVLLDVANRLAALGIACLRFDYYGTGDSDGDGERHDLAEMRRDLEFALVALRGETGASRTAVLAWRGSALPVWDWASARTDLAALALWEPVVDGAAWLAGLEAADRAERLSRYGSLHDDVGDTNLMGFPVSARWRNGIAGAKLNGRPSSVPLWLWQRTQDVGAGSPAAQRVFELPAEAPRFDGGVGVESVAFLSRALQARVDEFGRALMDLGR